MPDQSSAATEHAILQEITAPLETLPDDPVAVVNADFPAALRGYDRLAVDAYVQRTSQLVAEIQATRTPEAAVRRALERTGQQISGILQRAHETAEEITAQSRREAEDRLEKSRVEAAEIEAAARQRVRDLDVDTDRIWAERGRIVDDARELARQLIALAETAAERFPPADTNVYDDDASLTRAAVPVDDEPDMAAGANRTEAAAGQAPLPDPIADYEEYEEYGDAPAADQEPPAEDVDQTVAFNPLAPSADDGTDDEALDEPVSPASPGDGGQSGAAEPGAGGAPRPSAAAEQRAGAEEPAAPPPPPVPADHRRSSSVIPPASQAASRRTSH